MKLPEDPKERKKMIILVVILGAGALYGVFAAVGRPLVENRRKTITDIENMKSKMTQSGFKLEQVMRIKTTNEEILSELMTDTDTHILKPRLGNFLLVATEIVDAHAKKLGLVVATEESGIINLPTGANIKATPGTELPDTIAIDNPPLKIYELKVSLKCSYFALHDLIASMQTENPYVVISEIRVQKNPDDLEKHRVEIAVQWPVWADTELRDALREAFVKQTTKKEG